MRTIHAKVFGKTGHYQYSADDSILAIKNYAQTEPIIIKK
jgi:hypothetical protein